MRILKKLQSHQIQYNFITALLQKYACCFEKIIRFAVLICVLINANWHSPAQVGNITQMIAYPDAIFNDTYLLETSEAVGNTKGNSYFLTAQVAEYLAVVENLAELTQPVNKSKLVCDERERMCSGTYECQSLLNDFYEVASVVMSMRLRNVSNDLKKCVCD